MYLILPKTRPVLDSGHLPLFFLAGPIRGGGDWHHRAATLLAGASMCLIANPSRYTEEHPLYRYRLEGPEPFAHQTFWERYYMRQAAGVWRQGCLIFWLPCESSENPRTDGDPYARDTYGELGEWRALMAHDTALRVVIGAEPGFPGLKQIQLNFYDALGSAFVIHDSLETVVQEALRVARRPSFAERVGT
jgi:hypothetical protein